MRFRMFGLVAVFVAATFGNLAHADITPDLTSVTSSGGNFLFNYSISEDGNEQLLGGTSYFTIYDVVGYDTTVVAPAGWTFTAQLVGVTPSTQNVTDDPSLWNITFDYTGATVLPGPASFSGFEIGSADSGVNAGGVFAYQTSKISGGIDQGQGPIGVPSVAAPDASGLSLLGACGLFLLGAIKRKFAS